MSIKVLDARGDKEVFSWKKVYRSAKRVGASPKLAKKIADEIQQNAYDGIRTFEIFKQVQSLLHQETPTAALRFNLKEGMRRLGPTGFKFEKYIASIFSKLGYAVDINQLVSGKCLPDYEIDFLATNGEEKKLKIGECKYHNIAGGIVDTEVALANYARFLDIQEGPFLKKKSLKEFHAQSIIVTNSRFSSRAITYCQDKGVGLLGWNYPSNNGLAFLIDSQKLYPITILPSLSNHLAELFAGEQIMLAGDLLDIS